jgi:hypothetical protein
MDSQREQRVPRQVPGAAQVLPEPKVRNPGLKSRAEELTMAQLEQADCRARA